MDISVLVPPTAGDRLQRTLPRAWRGEVIVLEAGQTRNVAARLARAPVLCFVDAATVLLPGWLPPMVRLLKRAPRAGCIGNIHREPYSGLIEHAGLRFDAEGRPASVVGNPVRLPRDASDRHPAVSLACALVRRSLFEKIGGFDERFGGTLLGDVDFCLRAAAETGCRHYVANRSIVYRHTGALPAETSAARQLFDERWRARIRACQLRRAALLCPDDSPEAREIARETRRLDRREIFDARRIGRTYLLKHLHRPWRYNYTRLCRALVQGFQPPPAAVPPPDVPDLSRPDDGWLFDPPPQA